jgi:hypothetical protein
VAASDKSRGRLDLLRAMNDGMMVVMMMMRMNRWKGSASLSDEDGEIPLYNIRLTTPSHNVPGYGIEVILY